MEKIMRLMSVSDLQSRSYTDRQGQSQVIESYEVRFDDGEDSVIGETSQNLTRQIQAAAKSGQGSPLVPLACYQVSFRLVARSVKNEKGERYFQNVSIMNLLKIS